MVALREGCALMTLMWKIHDTQKTDIRERNWSKLQCLNQYQYWHRTSETCEPYCACLLWLKFEDDWSLTVNIQRRFYSLRRVFFMKSELGIFPHADIINMVLNIIRRVRHAWLFPNQEQQALAKLNFCDIVGSLLQSLDTALQKVNHRFRSMSFYCQIGYFCSFTIEEGDMPIFTLNSRY